MGGGGTSNSMRAFVRLSIFQKRHGSEASFPTHAACGLNLDDEPL